MAAKGTFVLSIDEGTTGVGAFLYDKAGKLVGTAEEDFPQHFPRPGWVEHDPAQIWDATRRVIANALRQIKAKPEAVVAIGITNQRETTLMWEAATGTPIHRAIVWQDRRTTAMCDALRKEGHANEIRERTGLVLDPYFSATKIQWLLDSVPNARARAEKGELRFGTIDTWLLSKLTGGKVHATEVSNASRTMLMNLENGAWDDRLLEIFDIPRSVLPEIRPSAGHFGNATKDIFGAEAPITGILGDQQSALFGQACFSEGQSKNTYGTGSFLLANTGSRRIKSERLLATAAWNLGGPTTYALEGSVFVTGAAIQWIRDGLGIISNAEETEVLARRVPDTGGVYFVPALTGLGAPHWEPNARGTITGLTRGTTKAHLARAALEAIAFQVADVVAAFGKDASTNLSSIRVDGGGAKNKFLLQFQADILGFPVEKASHVESTALGAAYAAGLGAKIWSSTDELARLWMMESRYEPKMAQAERAERLDGWHRAVENCLALVNDRTTP
ncbi:MAG: glycerol kinase GlpK [Thermoplasmatota archaeon]